MTRVGVIVPTRNNRPNFLRQCMKYVGRQTHQPAHIEIVDYPQKTFPVDLSERYKYGFERMRDKCDLIVIMEDDDWYAADYVENLVKIWEASNRPQIVGYSSTIYYFIHTQNYCMINHPGRASAMSTAISADAVILLDWKQIDPLWFDIGAWQQLQGVAAPVAERWLSLGVKHGLGDCHGAGHKRTFYRGERDNVDYGMQYFKKIVGDDFRFYAEIIARKEP